MSEEQADYAINKQPAAIIESPRKVKALQDKGLVEYQVWGWVKVSANFIGHVNILRGSKLAIWLIISLSIDETGNCDLPLKDLVALSGYSRTEVIESLKELYQLGYLSVEKESGKKSIYNPQFAARGANNPDPSRKCTRPVPPLDSDKNQYSPSEENLVPTYKELKELIQKETKNMKTKKNPDVMARDIEKIVRAEKYLSPKKVREIVEDYLKEINEEGENAQQPDKPKKKEDKVNIDIKTLARSRGVSESEIEFIDRACKAFGFSIMQLDEVSLVTYRWIAEQESKGQTIERFADWARLDEMGKFIGKYRNSAGAIRNDWARAFGIKPPDDRTSLIRRMT